MDGCVGVAMVERPCARRCCMLVVWVTAALLECTLVNASTGLIGARCYVDGSAVVLQCAG